MRFPRNWFALPALLVVVLSASSIHIVSPNSTQPKTNRHSNQWQM